MKKIIMVIGLLAIIGVVLIIGLTIKKKNNKYVYKNETAYELTESEIESYSDEIKLFLDYDAGKISKEVAEKIISFSHQKGFGKITRVDLIGTKDYVDNGETIYLWTIVVNTENENILVDLSYDYSEIYEIIHNNKVYSFKNEKQNNNKIVEKENNKEIKWKEFSIYLDDKKYSYPFKLKNFLDNGWEADNSYDEKLLDEIIAPEESSLISLDNNKYTCRLDLDIINNSTQSIKPNEGDIEKIKIWQGNRENNSLLEIAGVKFGDTNKTAEKTFGKPNDIYTDEFRGYYDYIYNISLRDGTKIKLVLEFTTKENELYELTIETNY